MNITKAMARGLLGVGTNTAVAKLLVTNKHTYSGWPDPLPTHVGQRILGIWVLARMGDPGDGSALAQERAAAEAEAKAAAAAAAKTTVDALREALITAQSDPHIYRSHRTGRGEAL